jgi:hypothetical protein
MTQRSTAGKEQQFRPAFSTTFPGECCHHSAIGATYGVKSAGKPSKLVEPSREDEYGNAFRIGFEINTESIMARTAKDWLRF